jgi:hypothetical protein
MSQKYWVKVSDIPRYAGRCQQEITFRLWDGSKEPRQCSRSAVHAHSGRFYCLQHHPDEAGARSALEKVQRIAEKALADALKSPR